MYKNFLLILISAVLLGACAQPVKETPSLYGAKETLTESQKAFMENLASLCGNTYRGQQTYMLEGRESWAHMDFVMHVTVCNEDSILVPFHLDEDRSRTWMFIAEQDGLRFRHDHRYDDGTPHEVTMYGGYADDSRGTAYKQFFPADDFTCQNLPRSCQATWTVELSPELDTFTYRLYSNTEELIFQADFDLSNPLE